MRNKILIYTETISPRIRYIFDFILNEFSGFEFEFTSDKTVFIQSEYPKVNYSEERISNGVHLISDEFMFENEISDKVKFEDLNPIGKCFYALSRYEEYLPFEKDIHGRFSGKEKVYKTPFIDQWVLDFQEELKLKYPCLEFKKRRFELILTCDVDQAWKYKHKGLKRTLGAFAKDLFQLNFKEFQTRKRTISGKIKDCFDTFDFFKSLLHTKSIEPKMIFFWLMADYDKFDKNNPVNNLHFQNKIREVSEWAESGIHPSYASNLNPEKLKTEIGRLEKITGKKIRKSRHHYLKLNFPGTYQNLITNGIMEDYTLAYADETGFRAGTCTPFFWYDLTEEKQTGLKIHPFCAMDVAMRNYMKLSTQEATEELQRLKSEIRKVNGQMIVLFHNSNFHGEWEGWGKVFESLVEGGAHEPG